jgi:hypothetical protein
MHTDDWSCPDCNSTVKFKMYAYPVQLVWRDCQDNCLLSDNDMKNAYECEMEARWERRQRNPDGGVDYAAIMAAAKKFK